MSEQKKAGMLKEVWWGDLHSLGKNAAVGEGLGLTRGGVRYPNCSEHLDTALWIAREKKALPVVLTLLESGQCTVTVGKMEGYGDGAACLPNAAEAVCVALLRWAGVVVHLQKREVNEMTNDKGAKAQRNDEMPNGEVAGSVGSEFGKKTLTAQAGASAGGSEGGGE